MYPGPILAYAIALGKLPITATVTVWSDMCPVFTGWNMMPRTLLTLPLASRLSEGW